MTETLLVLLVLIGLGSGVIGAMLGLGGSLVIIPALNELLGPRQHLHQATAMIINFFVATAALWGHLRARAIMPAVIRTMIPAALVAVIIGVQVSQQGWFQGPKQVYLTAVFGGFMILVAIYNLRPHPAVGSIPAELRPGFKVRAALLVALPSGFLAGLLGVGGGLIAVPMQQLALGLPLPNAIANSVATICGMSLIGSLVKNYHWQHLHPGNLEPLILAAILLPSSVVGSLIGSRLTHRLPLRWLRGIFAVLLIAAGARQFGYLLAR